MRLFLLPIAKGRTLVYCERLNLQLTSKKSLVDKITTRGSALWVKWEGTEKGWQKKVTEWGNKAFARIPYEEWGLKSIPPLSARRKAEDLADKGDVEVVYPSIMIQPGKVLDELLKLATERQALHRKWMWGSIIGMPFTAPFALIPIIPNLPFFYLCFRAWSHWRALNGSKHVEFLVQKGLVNPTSSAILDKVYEIGKVHQNLSILVQTKSTAEKVRTAQQDISIELAETSELVHQMDASVSAGNKITPEDEAWYKEAKLFLESNATLLDSSELVEFEKNLKNTLEALESYIQAMESTLEIMVSELIEPKVQDLETKGQALKAELEKLKERKELAANYKDLEKKIKDVNKAFSIGRSLEQRKPVIDTGVGHEMFLSKGLGRVIAFSIDLPEVEVEIERAIDQVKTALNIRQDPSSRAAESREAVTSASKDE